jgi:stage V sporulation protein SpoVS
MPEPEPGTHFLRAFLATASADPVPRLIDLCSLARHRRLSLRAYGQAGLQSFCSGVACSRHFLATEGAATLACQPAPCRSILLNDSR